MYEVDELNITGGPHLVRVSFEMHYHDWLRFQKSTVFDLWKDYLQGLEKTESRQVGIRS